MFSRFFRKSRDPKQLLYPAFSESFRSVETSTFEAAHYNGRPDIVYNLRKNPVAQPLIFGFGMFVVWEAFSLKYPDNSSNSKLGGEFKACNPYLIAAFYNSYQIKFGEEAARRNFGEVQTTTYDRFNEICDHYTKVATSLAVSGQSYEDSVKGAWLTVTRAFVTGLCGPHEKPPSSDVVAPVFASAIKAINKLSETLKAS